ncbi:hypothetical protein TNCV_93281 [Trichonephila clavipes]|nr:hypothetical protein TNCV_93281 [Trichonephila clavipes]
MKDLTYAKKAGMHYMYGCANGNGRAALRMYHSQFPDRRMPYHRILLQCAHLPECHVWDTMHWTWWATPTSRFIEP